MRRIGAAVLLLALSFAATSQASTTGWPLQPAHTDLGSLASLQRGARNFVNYCLGCHSAKYMRYSQVAEDLALTEDELRQNLMFTGTRIYDAMVSSMPPEQARAWFGNAPPDLSLIARSRGVDYVYTFLKSFYADASRPTGANNAVLPQTAMPNVLAGLQGVQNPRYETTTNAEGEPVTHLAGLDPGTAG
ncbi:MAG: cytochrome c1, partial [Dongiaceae bacterium]